MKRTFKNVCAFLMIALVSVALVACGSSEGTTGDGEEKVTIRIADGFPGTHTVVKEGVEPWIDRIIELGEGKIEVDYFPAEQLGKLNSLLDAAGNKTADIVYLATNNLQDQLPLSSVSANAGIVEEINSGTKAFWKLLEEDLYELEYKDHGVKPLWAVTLNPYQIYTSGKPVKTVEDWKGLRIFSTGGIQEQILMNWDATPVTGPSPEIYSLWDRGTIDGIVLTLMSWPGYQIQDLAEYGSTNASLSNFGIVYAVNEEVWDSWPEDVQKIVAQASEEVMESLPNNINEVEAELREEYEEMGIEFYELPEDELERWNEELSKTNDVWADRLDERGLPGTEILEKYKQYNEEFQQE